MYLLLCILYLCQVIQAVPITYDRSEALTLLSVDHTSRTLWDIVSTCMITLFACIYSSLHPNVPSPHHTLLSILCQRAGTMAIALACPDVVVAWALRQWFWARHVTAKFTKEQFSVPHPEPPPTLQEQYKGEPYS
jgi:hypothetical protein